MFDIGHPNAEVAFRAADRMAASGRTLCVVPQVLCEFWVVATRPRPQNGLGLTYSDAIGALTSLLRDFELLPDDARIFEAWQRLLLQYRVMGKPAHDARIAAAMLTHGVTSILTFDPGGFVRFPELEVLDPAGV